MYHNEEDQKKSKIIIIGLLCFLGIILLFKFKTGMDYNNQNGLAFGDSGSSSSSTTNSGSSRNPKNEDVR